MDGLTLVRVLIKLNPEVKVSAGSGLGGYEAKDQKFTDFLELGVSVFLNKPDTADRMLVAFHEMLDDRPQI